MLVDLQLPIDLFNTGSEFATAIIQIVLIAKASLYALCAVPVLFAVIWVVQHFYLRTSKQLRMHDLEAKAALQTKLAEASAGSALSTIRAHGWSQIIADKFLEKVDRSQEPIYLLFAVQRWLQVVLNLVVAGLIVVVLGAAVALKQSHKVSPSAIGIAFQNATTLGETLTNFIVSWTGLETSLGAIARIAHFEKEMPVETVKYRSRQSTPPERQEGHGGGAVRVENVWATYQDPESESVTWSLRGISLDIKHGERVAVCGKTGSGKSTLHLALLRMVNMPTGSIYIDGIEQGDMSLEALRKLFFIVSQDKLESSETLRLELDPSQVFSEEALMAVLQECGMLEKVMKAGGIDTSKDDCDFSEGEEQLFNIARIMLNADGHVGGIILLDEATSR